MGLIAALPLALTAAMWAQEPEPVRPEVAVLVVTQDDLRQGQAKHGRSLLEVLGDERFGRYRWLEPAVSAEAFRSCEDDRPDRGLESCARFYLRESGAGPSTVVVAFADGPGPSPSRRYGAMRVACYGRGATASDAAAQFTWLWPDSARLRGVNDWIRDQDALAACIDAALAETPA